MARQAQGFTIPLEFTALIAFRGRRAGEIFRAPPPAPAADLAAQQKRPSYALPAQDSADQPQHPAMRRSET